jgi:hypothetical protein
VEFLQLDHELLRLADRSKQIGQARRVWPGGDDEVATAADEPAVCDLAFAVPWN